MSDQPALHAKVLTVSDGVIHGTREDRSGAALVEQLTDAGWVVVEHRVTADGVDNVANNLPRDVRRLRRTDRVDRRYGVRTSRPDPRGHAPGDRTRGPGPGRGDAAGRVHWAACRAGSPASAGRRSSATHPVRRRVASSNSARSSTSSRTPSACSRNRRPSIDDGRIACCGCSGWCCQRGRWRRRRSSCSRPPICPSCGRRRSTTRPPSTIRGSSTYASCGRRRSRCTSPRDCSTSGSPAATGWRRPAARWSASASCGTARPRRIRFRWWPRSPPTRPPSESRTSRRACG